MLSKVINLVVKFSGAGVIWEKLDGAKSYVGGAIGILAGAAGLLQEVLNILNSHDAGAALAFVKGLPHDQNILAIAAGLVAVGIRHAIAKQEPAPAQ